MGSDQLKSNSMDFSTGLSDHEPLLGSPDPALPGSFPHRPFFGGGTPLAWLIKSESFRRGRKRTGRAWYQRRRVKLVVTVIGLLGCFFLVDWLMLLRLQDQDDGLEDFGVTENSSLSSSSGVPSPIRVCLVHVL